MAEESAACTAAHLADSEAKTTKALEVLFISRSILAT